MSGPTDKIKNSRRRQCDENAVAKQLRIAKQHHTPGTVPSLAEKQPHRYTKHHAMDCGNPECYICGNPRKTHKDKLTQQEKRLFQDVDNIRDKRSNGKINTPDE